MSRAEPRRGEVWQVSFSPTRGSEIYKKRPAVVISSDHVGVLPLKLVVPLTEWNPTYAGKLWIVRLEPSKLNGLTKASAAETLQTRAVAIERFLSRRGAIDGDALEAIVSALAIVIEVP